MTENFQTVQTQQPQKTQQANLPPNPSPPIPPSTAQPPMTTPKKPFLKIILFVFLVVIFLAFIGLTSLYLYNSNQMKNRDAKRKADFGKIAQALEKARADSLNAQYYPLAITSVTLEKSGYIQKIPNDPINSSPFVYDYQITPPLCGIRCTGYILTACLENKNDKGKNTTSPIAPCTTRTYKISK